MLQFLKNYLNKKEILFLALLILIGAFLRLYHFRSTLIFLGDQGRDVLIVKKLLTEGDLILIGPTTSVGEIQLGPLFYYFMAPWLWLFNYDPMGPAIGIALIGIITILVFYLISKQIFDNTTAWFATLGYTFSNIVISNTRSSWNPNPMPLVTMLFFWAVYKVYQQKQYKYLIWVWVLFAIALQLHYMILLISPFIILFWIYSFHKSIDKNQYIKNWLIGLSIFIILSLPLVIFDLRHDFINTKGFVSFFVKGHHSPKLWWQPVKDMEGRLYQSIGDILGLNFSQYWRNLLTLIILGSSMFLFINNKIKKNYQLLYSYFFISLLGLSIYSGDVYPHYLGFIFFASFIIFALLLTVLWKSKIKILKYLSILSITLLILINLKQYPYQKSLGWQIDDIKKISQTIGEDAGNTTYNIVLIDDTRDYKAMNYRYFLSFYQNKPLEIDNYEKARSIYLISPEKDLGADKLKIWEIESFVGIKGKDAEIKNAIQIKTKKTWQFVNGPWVSRIDK